MKNYFTFVSASFTLFLCLIIPEISASQNLKQFFVFHSYQPKMSCEQDVNKGGVNKLIDEQGAPNGVYTWELQNSSNNLWYLISGRAITRGDNRIVRLEIATDITERKKLKQYRQK